jgi:MFS family permease
VKKGDMQPNSSSVFSVEVAAKRYEDGLVAIMFFTWGAISSLLLGAVSDRAGRKVVLVPLTVPFSLLSGVWGLARNVYLRPPERAHL